MSIAALIRGLGRSQISLSEAEAYTLFSAMLDEGLPDLELGALLFALRTKGESLEELLGFKRAVSERLYCLQAPAGDIQPVIIPAYGGKLDSVNLLPLLALLLQRFGVTVLIHGSLDSHDGVAAAYVLRELGTLPSTSIIQAQQALDQQGLAFLPTAALCPGLANLLSLRSRLGLRNSAHLLAKVLEPFSGMGLHLVSASQHACMNRLREFLHAAEINALLLQSSGGDPCANPAQRPQLEYISNGASDILFEAERGSARMVPNLPNPASAAATALWTTQVLAGEIPLPMPLVNQLACCLYASGYTQDMNQAKAIAAVEAGGLAAA
ncbi:MAG: DNA-binding protein YbiB [Pseudomonadota bacterium]|nr:DNA-binding protein YbiB [Gammaproteobacteria bacterium]MBU1732684.1 DNA-binding protein YbiB [Gammaproteobacteria bacterium]MBU1891509.1 DNA-binding protein YbiB [Gammaproteobacteria bacterium]